MTNTDIQIRPANGGSKILVNSPYNAGFIAGAKTLAARFDADTKGWIFDARDESRVRELLMQVYGSDGTAVAETVTVHIDLDQYYSLYNDRIVFAGRTVARRPARDSAVRLTGAVVVSGGFDASGGSVKNPRLDFQPGTTLEIRDVPAGHADVTDRGVTVVGTEIDRAALVAERAALVARLAEIDALL